MSLFKSRSGGSLFRFRALTGYFKYLFEKKDDSPTDPPVGELENRMTARFKVEKDVES